MASTYLEACFAQRDLGNKARPTTLEAPVTECTTPQPACAALRQMDAKRGTSPKVWTTRLACSSSLMVPLFQRRAAVMTRGAETGSSPLAIRSTIAGSMFSSLRLLRKLGSRYGASISLAWASAAANTRMLFIGTPLQD